MGSGGALPPSPEQTIGGRQEDIDLDNPSPASGEKKSGKKISEVATLLFLFVTRTKNGSGTGDRLKSNQANPFVGSTGLYGDGEVTFPCNCVVFTTAVSEPRGLCAYLDPHLG